jgi:hypothetical protein
MNCYGKGRSQEYVVQFWDAGNLIAFEIIGGVVDDDKKSKVTTVVFEDEDCVHLETGKSIDTVSFTLVRTALRD